MITVFSTPKPFCGLFAVIQRNAIRSWTLLHPNVEVILFGDEEGTAEVAREMGVRHEPHIERNEFGTPLLNAMFRRAQEIAHHDWLCYSNADIIQTQQFRVALERARAWGRPALLAGQRWDIDIVQPLDFSSLDWGEMLSRNVQQHGIQRGRQWIDYFAFPRGICKEIPPFAVGRAGWDEWMIWKFRQSGVAVLDVSPSMVAIHQNHSYPPQAPGIREPWPAEESARNRMLAGGWRHCYSLDDATHVLQGATIRRTHRHILTQVKREWHHRFKPIWSRFLDSNRPLRHRFGIRRIAKW